jgi:aspartate/methionine/tyrosine aminotransferase
VYAGLPPGIGSSEQFCEALLEKYHVAITPGTDFGLYGADEHVRFTYAEDMDRLSMALERIEKALMEAVKDHN